MSEFGGWIVIPVWFLASITWRCWCSWWSSLGVYSPRSAFTSVGFSQVVRPIVSLCPASHACFIFINACSNYVQGYVYICSSLLSSLLCYPVRPPAVCWRVHNCLRLSSVRRKLSAALRQLACSVDDRVSKTLQRSCSVRGPLEPAGMSCLTWSQVSVGVCLFVSMC